MLQAISQQSESECFYSIRKKASYYDCMSLSLCITLKEKAQESLLFFSSSFLSLCLKKEYCAQTHIVGYYINLKFLKLHWQISKRDTYHIVPKRLFFSHKNYDPKCSCTQSSSGGPSINTHGADDFLEATYPLSCTYYSNFTHTHFLLNRKNASWRVNCF